MRTMRIHILVTLGSSHLINWIHGKLLPLHSTASLYPGHHIISSKTFSDFWFSICVLIEIGSSTWKSASGSERKYGVGRTPAATADSTGDMTAYEFGWQYDLYHSGRLMISASFSLSLGICQLVDNFAMWLVKSKYDPIMINSFLTWLSLCPMDDSLTPLQLNRMIWLIALYYCNDHFPVRLIILTIVVRSESHECVLVTWWKVHIIRLKVWKVNVYFN